MRKFVQLAFLLLLPMAVLAQTDWHTEDIPEYVNRVNPHDCVRRTPNKAIIISGKGDSLRAFSVWSGGGDRAKAYADVVNKYHDEFDSLRIYVVPIPTQGAFYTPTAAREWNVSERIAIQTILQNVASEVAPVNVYTVLGNHASEPIYSRTDHHWAALGAYYASEEFAKVAGVPFKDLSHYDTLAVKNYVGTMSIFSKDAAVKRSPETFFYYIPKEINYETTYIKYTLDRGRRYVVKESDPCVEPFFLTYPDGSRLAYCTFVGGDDRLVHVKTEANNGRRLLILKDSFGNALPGYLFWSFEDIHIVDCRYFTKNLKEYIASHQVTDILFANNISHACLEKTVKSYEKYLIQ